MKTSYMLDFTGLVFFIKQESYILSPIMLQGNSDFFLFKITKLFITLYLCDINITQNLFSDLNKINLFISASCVDLHKDQQFSRSLSRRPGSKTNGAIIANTWFLWLKQINWPIALAICTSNICLL